MVKKLSQESMKLESRIELALVAILFVMRARDMNGGN